MNFESTNKSRSTLHISSLILRCGVGHILNVFLKIEIIKINHKSIKPVIVYEIYVTVKVIKTDNRHSERTEGFSRMCFNAIF